MDSITLDPAAELKRRRQILNYHIGGKVQIKRSCLSTRERKSGLPFVGTLVEVRRTKASIRFGEPVPPWSNDTEGVPWQPAIFGLFGQWSVPINWILLPSSIEPLPGQLALIIDVATDVEVAR